ncbi:hypothetical protein FHS85_003159 [Rhodoligotrophos appendicifer]
MRTVRKGWVFVVKQDVGWAYKSSNIYSRKYDTRAEAVAAALSAAQVNFSNGKLTQVMSQADDGTWQIV